MQHRRWHQGSPSPLPPVKNKLPPEYRGDGEHLFRQLASATGGMQTASSGAAVKMIERSRTHPKRAACAGIGLRQDGSLELVAALPLCWWGFFMVFVRHLLLTVHEKHKLIPGRETNTVTC